MAQWFFVVSFIVYFPQLFGIICHLCHNETDLSRCSTLTECPNTEMCEANRSPDGSGGYFYTLGCIPKSICDRFVFGRRSTHLTGCCNTNYCNKNVFNEVDLITTSSSIATLPTTKPATTIAPTSATSTLLATTTHPSTIIRRCHQCGDTQGGYPCTGKQITTPQLMDCPDSQHVFCLTDYIQDAHGNADMYKRCVTEYQCRIEWILETAGADSCTKLGSIQTPYPFQCHFCCTTDGCNTNIVPDPSTWYAKV